jgi:uncharacterized membrane protein YgdD (TMEM256/DUF423 family)
MNRRFLHIAALMGASAVILGAFAAHKLKELLDPRSLEAFHTGVTYQFYHTFALLAVGILYRRYKNKWLTAAGILFVVGTLLFSGSRYLMAIFYLLGEKLGPIGMVTPIGGVVLIAGRILFFMGVPATRHHGERDHGAEEQA